jgi:hypothetical protein
VRLVDDDGDYVEIEDLTADDVLGIVLQYEAKISELREYASGLLGRISDLESDVEYYKYELARVAW